MKAKMRERVRPKLGKIDIDYQKLHDAFFKWQTKPKLSIHGDLYYEVSSADCLVICVFYIAQYAVHWTAESALHFAPWQTCLFFAPTQLL